jgi:hypothetical protein
LVEFVNNVEIGKTDIKWWNAWIVKIFIMLTALKINKLIESIGSVHYVWIFNKILHGKIL